MTSHTPFVIAIDGPAASGKGTLARNLAHALNCAHLDTGALYRYVGWSILEKGGDPEDEDLALTTAQNLEMQPDFDNPQLKTDEAGQAASKVAAMPPVREALLAFQQNFAQNPPEGFVGAVLDGRDIGTVICPDATVKLFITADSEVRAQRRFKELQSKGFEATYEAVLADINARDARDTERQTAPLKAAADAFTIDTSHMDEAQALEAALDKVHAKGV